MELARPSAGLSIMYSEVVADLSENYVRGLRFFMYIMDSSDSPQSCKLNTNPIKSNNYEKDFSNRLDVGNVPF